MPKGLTPQQIEAMQKEQKQKDQEHLEALFKKVGMSTAVAAAKAKVLQDAAAALVAMKEGEVMTPVPTTLAAAAALVAMKEGEVMTPVPTTLAAGVDRYQAAKQLRIIARNLTKPVVTPFPSMIGLEKALSRRSTKAERLAILERLKTEQAHWVEMNRSHIEQIKHLVQHLPTQPDLPNGKPENVLRAIRAVLDNYEKGYGHG